MISEGGLFVETLTGAGAPGAGAVLQTVSANLAIDVTNTSVPPVYAALLSVPITVGGAGRRIAINFYAAWRHVGAAIIVAANFRFLLDAALMAASRGTTSNAAVSRIEPVSFCRVIAVAAGPHTVLVEWAGFGLGANTMVIDPATLPDLSGAQLIVQELS